MTYPHPPSHPLVHAIRSFDYTLQRPVLTRMNLEHIETVLDELDDFNEAVEWLYDGLEDPELAPQPYLAAVGCRLSCDLNEALTVRLSEKLQKQDQAVEELSGQLKRLLAERHRTARLLQKTHEIRAHNAKTGERLGLGLVL